MEKRITVHNPTAMPIYVGSNMVPPGDTRDFPESQVPPHLRTDHVEEAAPVTGPDTVLAALIRESVKEVLAKLPELSDADLALLIAMEELGQARKTLLDPLNKALAERSLDDALAGLLDADAAEIIADLGEFEPADLERLSEMEAAGANREAVLTAIAGELIKRKG